MKERKVFEKEYDLNNKLHILYEVIDALYKPLENDYPPEIKNNLNILIDSINKYLYHAIDGTDIIKEKYYTKITYKEN